MYTRAFLFIIMCFMYFTLRCVFVLLSGLSIQVTLGALTLIKYVPTSLAASHQAGAMALLTFALWLMSELRKKLPKL